MSVVGCHGYALVGAGRFTYAISVIAFGVVERVALCELATHVSGSVVQAGEVPSMDSAVLGGNGDVDVVVGVFVHIQKDVGTVVVDIGLLNSDSETQIVVAVHQGTVQIEGTVGRVHPAETDRVGAAHHGKAHFERLARLAPDGDVLAVFIIVVVCQRVNAGCRWGW